MCCSMCSRISVSVAFFPIIWSDSEECSRDVPQHTCHTLQRTAPHCNTTATYCNTLGRMHEPLWHRDARAVGWCFTLKVQHTATQCNTVQHMSQRMGWCFCHGIHLQKILSRYSSQEKQKLQRTATHCNTLQHTATHCDTLRHTATHCDTLQYSATHCNPLLISETFWNSWIQCNQHRGKKCALNRIPTSKKKCELKRINPWFELSRNINAATYIYIWENWWIISISMIQIISAFFRCDCDVHRVAGNGMCVCVCMRVCVCVCVCTSARGGGGALIYMYIYIYM